MIVWIVVWGGGVLAQTENQSYYWCKLYFISGLPPCDIVVILRQKSHVQLASCTYERVGVVIYWSGPRVPPP